MKINWQGVYPALTTKFTNEDMLDIQAFEKNLKAQLDSGIDGVILGGSLGEASTLLREEKIELLQAGREFIGSRIPVLMNVAERSTKAAIIAAHDAEENGADGIMLLPPMQYKATDNEVVDYFLAVAKSISIPILIYNNPVDYKIEVTLDMFEELLKMPNIQAVKESTRNLSNVTKIRNRFGNNLKVLCGVDTLALESLLMGADGWVAGLVCAFPRETVAVYRLARAGQLEEARKIYRWFMPILELDISPQLVQNIKLAEYITGIGTEIVRPPRKPLSGNERKRVLAILEEGMKNRPMLPDYLTI
jgi:4-hydroxy-tetrahydrodipicolinate synthase